MTDVLELKAIESVYRPAGDMPCELGSMKPNIGHPLCAEGIASFLKSVLMLHHRQRVPFLSGQQPMRYYDVSASPFRFSRAASRVGDAPSVAAINCFADGGTNVHVILEAWRDPQPRQAVRQPTAPPPLRKIECRPAKRGEGRDSAPTVARIDHGVARAGVEWNASPREPDFWELCAGLASTECDALEASVLESP